MDQLEKLSKVVFESNSMNLLKGSETPDILGTIRQEFAEIGDVEIALRNAQLIDKELCLMLQVFLETK